MVAVIVSVVYDEGFRAVDCIALLAVSIRPFQSCVTPCIIQIGHARIGD